MTLERLLPWLLVLALPAAAQVDQTIAPTDGAAAPVPVGAASAPVPGTGASGPSSRGNACPNAASVMGNGAFPRRAIELGLEKGDALVEFTLTAAGATTNVHSVRASHPVFADAAESIVRQYVCAGQGRDIVVQVPFTFKLEPAVAASSDRHAIRGDPRTGSNIGQRQVTGSLPFDKPYAALTSEEQARFMAAYEPMAPGDEPPFPLGGLGELFRPIAQAQQKLLVRDGTLEMDVRVGADGSATGVEILRQPTPEMGTFAAKVAMAVRFKPAVCKGQPCAMSFPVRIRFDVKL